jgi:hypothetical protein
LGEFGKCPRRPRLVHYQPFSEADLMDTSARVLNGHFRGFKTIVDTEA